MAMEEGSSHAGDGSDDDDVPRLSSHALLALNDFLREQQQMNLMNNGSGEEGEQQQQGQGFAILREDWGMSQFWYDAPTARTLADEVLHLSESFGSNIACVACPSLYVQLKNSCPGMSVTLFEFDRRFARYGSDFTYYDYNYPQNLDDKFSHFFDIVVADPPYLELCNRTMQAGYSTYIPVDFGQFIIRSLVMSSSFILITTRLTDWVVGNTKQPVQRTDLAYKNIKHDLLKVLRTFFSCAQCSVLSYFCEILHPLIVVNMRIGSEGEHFDQRTWKSEFKWYGF